MKEENAINQAVAEMLQKATSATEKAVDFLSGELPDVIHQLLLWELTWSIVGVLLSIVLGWMSFYFFKKVKNDDLWLILAFATGMPALIMFFVNLYKMLMILVAPKIFLIKYAADLIK